MGAVTAIGIQAIFTVLGIAVGTSLIDADASADGSTVRGVSIAAGVWWLVSGTVALMLGGLVVGRLSDLPRNVPLMLEAVAMWGLVAVFGFLVVWSGAGMLSQAASPIAAMSATTSERMGNWTSREQGTASSPDSSVRLSDAAMATRAEEARRATRTASWWAVVGLLAGIGATVGGAYVGAGDALRNRFEAV